MAELYEPLVGFNLWITRDGQEQPELKSISGELVLPKSKKQYKLTLKNLKVYITETFELDPTIREIQIDRIISVGIVRR